MKKPAFLFIISASIACAALWFLMWFFASTSLASGYCNNYFSLLHEEFRCRQPLLAGVGFVIASIASLVLLVLGVRRKNQFAIKAQALAGTRCFCPFVLSLSRFLHHLGHLALLQKTSIAIVASVLLSFYAGVRYEQIDRHRQEILIFANVQGDHLVETNRLIESFGKKKKEDIVKEYNKSTLDDIGCSAWLEYLVYFEEKDLSDFNAGVKLAIEKVGSVSAEGDECINNILKENILGE